MPGSVELVEDGPYSLAVDINRPSATAYYHKPRGAWKLEALYAVDASANAQRVPRVADTVVYARFNVTEPLLLSPFVLGQATANRASTASKQ